jgi:hypothetical protein
MWAAIRAAAKAQETKKAREAERVRAASTAPVGDGSPSAEDEALNAVTKQAVLLNAQCKWADNYLKDSHSTDPGTCSYGKAKLEETINRSLATAQATGDGFY